MVAGMRVVGDGAPKRGSEDDDGKQKEDAGDFEPENTAHAAEGTQESAHAAAHGTPGLYGGARCGLAGGAVWVVRTLGLGAGNWSVLMHLRHCGRGLRGSRQALPGHAPGDADSDAQGAANPARSHTVYDGSSGLRRFVPRL